MAAPRGPFLAAVLLLVSFGLHCASSLTNCPQSCTCQRAPLLNCSSSGLSSVPQHIQDSVTELDLSHNLLDSVTLRWPHRNLRSVWLGNNSIAHLSLCTETNLKRQYLRGLTRRLGPRSSHGCVSWAPTLQLLSVERNQLEQLPEGLEGMESLQVLQLSFNRISTLRPGDLGHLRQLKELHLQHNLITSLHPQMFQELAQLRVLDLSFNMLTSLHPLMYLTLRNVGTDVRLGGNRWQCDCSMRSLRRRMAYDSSRGLQAWGVMCASPSILSGRDLLHLEEDDLNCFSAGNSPELHQDVTVYSGSEILLSCSTQDSMWWTPSGQVSARQPQEGLLISDITGKDTGLYVCVSEKQQIVSFFNLQISQIEGAQRKPRSLPRTSRQIPQDTPNRVGEERNQRVTQSNLALAVCLSVFITFLIAFILGVLARPCIDALWKRVTNKKSPSATHSVSSVEQRQYDNEAFANGEEPEVIGPGRERRVTFSSVDYREDSNVQYYDTVAGGDLESINDVVIECEGAEAKRDEQTAGDSGSENSSQQSGPEDKQNDGRALSGDTSAGPRHKMEFEHIPDPGELEERRSLSSYSSSSQSEKDTRPRSAQLAEDSVQQKADFCPAKKAEVPQISIEEGNSEIPGFSSEPFADWSPHTNPTDPDISQENEELFEFSDSVRSTSARSSSLFGSFKDPKLTVAPTSYKQKGEDTSSSSSYISDNEPTHYTVNPDQEEDASFGLQKTVRPDHSFSSDSSDNEQVQYRSKQETKDLSSRIATAQTDTRETVTPMPRTKRGLSLGVASHSKSLDGAPSISAAYSSSSSSGSDAEITDPKEQHNKGRVSQIMKHSDINAPLSDSSSSDESADQTLGNMQKQNIPRTKKHLDINAPSPSSDSSSSSDSEDETTGHAEKQSPGKLGTARLPFQESQTKSNDPDARCPAVDLQHIPPINGRLDITAASDSSFSSDSEDETTGHANKQMLDTRIKRRLDVKAPSPPSDSSSSSDSEDETTGHIKKQERGSVQMSRPAIKLSQTGSHEPASDSSSSSDSEDETTGHANKQIPGQVDTAWLLFQESQTKSHNPDFRWPAIDLQHIPHIKTRLDIKAPSPASDSSSSSDSEDETTGHIKKQEQGSVHMARPAIKVSPTVSHKPGTQWPSLDLEHTTRIKRRLDIKAPSPASDSSFSSDSEDETTAHTAKQSPEKLGITRLPFQESHKKSHDPDARWPTVDLQHIPGIKRRLDIKVSATATDSSSSSDSEDETTGHSPKQSPGKIAIAQLPFQESQTKSHDPDARWPAVDLQHIPHIKRHLDIKAPSPASDSSSSSDSEDETTGHIKKQQQGSVHMARPAIKVSPTVSHKPGTQWPSLDLEHTTRIKRRLDIKAPSPASDSSFSSDSEDETTDHTAKQSPEKLGITRLPFQESHKKSHDPDARWPTVDLQHIPGIKRRLDIKVSSTATDSSSSSDSEDETTGYTAKQSPEKLGIAQLTFQESQTKSHDPDARWPAVDLQHIPHIKRRLDIKAPSPASDSSSSSDSEDETTGYTAKQSPEKLGITRLPFQESHKKSHDPDARWPTVDLQHIPGIKRRLDIKAPSPASDSSSSSDSEDGLTGHSTKQSPRKVDITRLPFQQSQTKSLWPTVDLQHIPGIKRRLDIKVSSTATDSSSSSDSEDGMTGHSPKQSPGKIAIAQLPFQESQTKSHDPETKWPTVDLQHIPHIKRRLDIKAPSPASDSSSSSDSEDETTGYTAKQSPEKLGITPLSFTQPQTKHHDPDARWPTVDLQHIPGIKRRLDIKAPSPASDSSSSSDSEDETTDHTAKQSPEKLGITRLPFQESHKKSHDPDARWPTVDLQHIPGIKRRLDIKVSSTATDSSSSSDSEDETTGHSPKQSPGKIASAQLPFQESQTKSHDPETKWPTVELQHIPHIKRRLDIKAPSPASDSSSSSDSEDETTGHTEKQSPRRLDITPLSFTQPQTKHHDPDARWPTVDLQHIPGIKRRLDIKAPSPASDSSSSSDSEDETTGHIKKQQQGSVHMARPAIKVSPTVSHKPGTQWPSLDLEHTTRIKRRLDIKAPSPASDSSSSSDSEDGLTGHSTKQSPRKVDITRLPFQQSQTKSHDPDARWPSVDLQHIPGIKRRLDIKAPSPASDSTSSSDSEDETTGHTEKQSPGKIDIVRRPSQESHTKHHDPDARWPAVNLQHIPGIKRRLDIKAPSPQPDLGLSGVPLGSQQSKSNSSRSESDDEKMGHKTKVASKASEKEFIRFQKTPLISFSHTPKTDHDIKLEKYTVTTDDMENRPTSDNIRTSPEVNQELQKKWASMSLGVSRFRKRLEITPQRHEPPNLPSSPPPDSPSSSSSESGTGSKSSTTRRQRLGMQEVIRTDSSLTLENKPVYVYPTSKYQRDNSSHSMDVKERLIKDYSLSTTEGKSIPDTKLVGFGTPQIRRYLDIRVSEKAPATQTSQQLADSSSSSHSKEEVDYGVPDRSLVVPRIKRRLDIKAPSPEPSTSTSSSSESENEVTGHTAKQNMYASSIPGMADDSLITYKRSIMKTSSSPIYSVSPSGVSQSVGHTKQRYTEAERVTEAQEGEGDRHASLAAKRVSSLSFDNVVNRRIKQDRRHTDLDVPPEIRWTGIGHHLSDPSISTARTSLNAALTSPEPAGPELPPGSKSDVKIKQESWKSHEMLTRKYSSLTARSVAPASSGALDKLDQSPGTTFETYRAVSEDGKERKGLSAIKTMSSERQKWDHTDLDKDPAPLFADPGPHDTSINYWRSGADIKPLSNRPLTQSHLPSASLDLLYGIPHYRTHVIRDIKRPQEAPPPIPATPPPDEAVELRWNSPQSSKKQGWEGNRSHQQQRGSTEGSSLI